MDELNSELLTLRKSHRLAPTGQPGCCFAPKSDPL